MSNSRPEIQCGRTTWILTSDGVYYVPRVAPPNADPANLKWRHHMDKQSGKMYFSNATGAVEWKLPDVTPAEGADASSGVLGENPEIRALTRPADNGTPTANLAGDAAMTTRQRVLDKIQERLRSSRSPSPAVLSGAPLDRVPSDQSSPAPLANTSLAAPPISNATLDPPPQSTATASASPQAAAPPATSPTAGDSAAAGGSASYWKERLQRHRSHTTVAQRSPNAAASPLAPTNNDFQRPPPAVKNVTFNADQGNVSPSPTNPAIELNPGETILAPPPVMDKAALEERRRQMVAADAALQAERAEVIRLERIALDRQRLAASELARQEEEHAAIVARRKELEQRRQELEQNSLRELEARKMEAAARAAAAAAGLVAEDEEVPTALTLMQKSADARIRASHEFASALSLAMLQDLQAETAEAPVTEELTKTVAGLKQSSVHYDASHRYLGTMRGKQKHGKGKYSLHKDDHFFYEGDWVADKKHGTGVASLPHVMYEGDWKEDKPSGKGVLHTQRMQASAAFSNGVAHGNAVAQLASGESFGGKLRSNNVATPGALTLTAGDRVEWRSADPTRPGTGSALVAYTSGDSYSGAIADWKLHGEGQYYFADTKDTYVGTFTRGEFTGEGTYTFAEDGSVYQGTVVKGYFHGRGKYVTNEAVYDGDWVEGRMHGKGTITYSNGDVWRGTFENDRRVKGKYIFSKAFILA